MKLIDINRKLNTESKCLDYLEQMRWPSGLCCIKCGVMDRISKFSTNETKRKRFSKKQQKVVTVKVPARRLYECLECGHQFAATAGTIFHDTHLPLVYWFMAIALFMEAKKGVSANQLKRHLGVNYRTAWHLAHRIREAMQDDGLLSGVVEADETYLTPKKPRKGRPYVKKQHTDVVLGMVERGGKLRLIPVANTKMASIEPELRKHIAPGSMLQTDESSVYYIIGKRFDGEHRTINHSRRYVDGDSHTNTIENAFSLLKRGVYGTFHKVSIKHLGRYCNEFSYRFNRREEQEAMFGETVRNLLNRKPLPYKELTAHSQTEEF